MARIKYEDWKPKPDALRDIRRAVEICEEYRLQGYDLTLRQLYYQYVSRGFIPNNDRSYKRLGSVVNKARMAGLMDWDYIVDRTRNIKSIGHYDTPHEIIDVASRAFRLDKWVDQPTRVEIWVEKEALAGVVERICSQLDCAWFSCRGYVSQSEQWGAAQRLKKYIEAGQNVVILHLGDHDPSGIDMTRDITDRLTTFITQDFVDAHADEVERNENGRFFVSSITAAMRERCGGREPLEIRRIALNMDQIEEYDPPPNPAKITDSRATSYIEIYGEESWELDALEPTVLADLIQDEVLDLRDEDLWEAQVAAEDRHRELLNRASERWDDLVDVLDQAV